MTGDECVAVCSDLRYGRELQTIATDFPKVHTNRVFKGHAFNCVLGFRDEPLPLGGSAWPSHRHSDGILWLKPFLDGKQLIKYQLLYHR